MNNELSEKIKTLRLKIRWTQEELALAARVSRKSVSTLENDAFVQSANLSTLLKVLSAMGYQIEFTPRHTPTLDDLFKMQHEDIGSTSASRVRKTRAEIKFKQEYRDASCD